MASNINTGIVNAFGIHARKITREKNSYICEADGGLFKLMRESDTAEKILFRHQAKEYAVEAGYPFTDRFRTAENGQPFAVISNEIWTASSYVKGREVSFDSWNDIEKAIAAVKRWHTCMRGLPVNESFTAVPLTENFRKQASELNVMAKRVRRQTRLSDFDVMFIKNVASYGDQIKKALLLLEQSDYSELYNNAVQSGHVCHNMLKEESLTIFGDNIYITCYEDLLFDTQLADIAALIRRYVRRAGQSSVPISQIVEAASKPEPLSPNELAALYAILLFPWNFMKTANQYYSKKRTWTPNAIINRMQTVISEAVFFNEYIKPLC